MTQALETLTSDLASVMAEKRMVDAHSAALAKHYGDIRSQIHTLMQQDGIKTADTSCARLQRKQGERTTVTDRAQLEAALTEAGLLDSVQKVTTAFDLNAAKKIGIQHEMPGIEKVPYDELAVTFVEVS